MLIEVAQRNGLSSPLFRVIVETSVGRPTPSRSLRSVSGAAVGPIASTGTSARGWRAAVPCAAVSGSVAEWERGVVARLIAGDDAALATVYDQFGALVFGLASRLVGRQTAPDIVQEVFAALWDHPERFDADRGSLRTFLVVLARRRCIDQLRRTGRRVANEERAHRSTTVVAPNVDEAAIAMITGDRLRTALSQLPEEQRRAITLAYFEGLTFRQVATETGVSEGQRSPASGLGCRGSENICVRIEQWGRHESTAAWRSWGR